RRVRTERPARLRRPGRRRHPRLRPGDAERAHHDAAQRWPSTRVAERHRLHGPLTRADRAVRSSIMHTSAIVLIDIALEDPNHEDAFLSWCAEAKALLAERVKPVRLELLVEKRGRYTVLIEVQFAGGFSLVTKDKPWQELEARRPRSTLSARELRIWHDG